MQDDRYNIRPNRANPLNPPPARGTASRRDALRLLDGVLRRGEPLELSENEGAPDSDRRLAFAIAAEVLRRLPDLDALIDSATQRILPYDAKVRMVLRMALAQVFALHVPQHAAISTALPLLDGGPRRLAHGVFGTLMRQGASLPEVPTLPDGVQERWRRHWGEEMVAAAGRAIASPPPLDLTFADPAETERLVADLEGRSLIPGHVRRARARVVELPGFDQGRWWVQDVSASLPARLLGSGEGRHALDLCAAPGGKTLQLAAAGWRVTAVDRSESRLARLSDNLARTGFAAELVTADLLDWEPEAPADAVLLDAPCTATGIFRRHPDVLHRVRNETIAEAAELQRQLIARAADWVMPGGRFVYATCSLEPEEGEAIAEALLAERADFAPATLETAMPAGVAQTEQGFLRILPGAIEDPEGSDGFFIAAFDRR